MAQGGDQDRTEKATPKKLQEAREKGQVAKSREVCSVAVLMACLLAFHFAGGKLFGELVEMCRSSFSNLHNGDFTNEGIVRLFYDLLIAFAIMVLPILALAFGAALLSNYIQVGFILTGKTIKPDISKLSPLKGFQRLFSIRSLVELAKSVMKLLIVACVAFLTVRSEMDGILPLVNYSIWDIFSFISNVSFKILVRSCWILIILAILDYIYQKWEYDKNLKMTKQEVKDEYKQTEGDPLVRSRIRSLQREMARRRMMEEVPKADVVITNPTHYAVALKYEKGMGAPVMVAKGAGFIAQRIREVAEKNKVPIIENRSVARLLYKVCDIGMEIPESLYRAVAEILAHVYRLRGKASA